MAKTILWNDIKPGMQLICENWQGMTKLRVNGMYNDMAMVSIMDSVDRKPFILKNTPDLKLRKVSFWDALVTA